jgi:hypothetical protein
MNKYSNHGILIITLQLIKTTNSYLDNFCIEQICINKCTIIGSYGFNSGGPTLTFTLLKINYLQLHNIVNASF